MKQFVDLAGEMGWTWIEFDNALALGNQGADPPEKWMAIPWIPEFVRYARSKGVSRSDFPSPPPAGSDRAASRSARRTCRGRWGRSSALTLAASAAPPD
jgi:hypothetical protein